MIWAYPTSTAKKAHAFPAEGQPSLCRRYYAAAMSLMDLTPPDSTDIQCSTCQKKANES